MLFTVCDQHCRSPPLCLFVLYKQRDVFVVDVIRSSITHATKKEVEGGGVCAPGSIGIAIAPSGDLIKYSCV